MFLKDELDIGIFQVVILFFGALYIHTIDSEFSQVGNVYIRYDRLF